MLVRLHSRAGVHAAIVLRARVVSEIGTGNQPAHGDAGEVDLPARLGGPDHDAGQDCTIVNLSVNGALVESSSRLPQDGETLTLQFTLNAPPDNQAVQVATRAAIRNVNVVQAGDGELFTYGLQFVALDPVHYTLLQNMTYEALLADRQKIV